MYGSISALQARQRVISIPQGLFLSHDVAGEGRFSNAATTFARQHLLMVEPENAKAQSMAAKKLSPTLAHGELR
jgi:hypothetical protein